MRTYENRMTGYEWEIYNYLKGYHVGSHKAISYEELCDKFQMNDREMRESIERIKRFKFSFVVIGSSDNGIFIPTRQERAMATAKYKQTAMSYVENQVANDPATLNDFYVLLNELKEKYPAPVQGQVQASFDGNKKEDVNYVGDKYLKDKQIGGLFAVESK